MSIWNRVFFLFFVSLALTCKIFPSDNSLTVRGMATLMRRADELILRIGVVTGAKTAEEALEENSEKMASVIQSLSSLDLTEEEYKTGHFSIRPKYNQRKRDDSTQEIISYEVTNSIVIKTEKITLAGQLIDKAVKNGANTIDSINFTLKDQRKYRDVAIEKATQNALQDAKTLSFAAGVTLSHIKALILDDAKSISPLPRGPFFAKSLAEAVPIEAGDVEIQAAVTLQFAID